MEISAAQFRKNFFQLLEQVARAQKEVIIKKRGKPVARLAPLKEETKKDPLIGGLAGLGSTVEDLTEPVADEKVWDLD